MEKITIELPIVKVNVGDNYLSTEYAREHYTDGLLLIDDGISQLICVHDGNGCVWNMPCPVRLVQDGIEAVAAKNEREKCAEVLENINNRLSQIARLVGETKDEVRKSENRLTDTIVDQSARQITEFNILSDKEDAVINNFVEMRDDLIDTIDEKFSGLPRSGEGMNILDVARAAAVIQKPELIKELGK